MLNSGRRNLNGKCFVIMITNNDMVLTAKGLGFELVGFAEAMPLEIENEHLSAWLGKGFQADMHYMAKNQDKRKNVKEILPDAKSVISLGMNYFSPYHYSEKKSLGKISRYAWGTDYHIIIWEKLYLLIQQLKEIDPAFNAISYVDTGPVMDKSWAVRAGLGWQGKHSNIINKDFGSWFFIANIISNQEFEYSIPIEDFCGSCTACLEACPTNAITEPYIVDSNKCISYQTIENKSEIPNELKGKFHNWIFGCDICQDVCPWNIKFSQLSSETAYYDKENKREFLLNKIKSMTQEEFTRLFSTSPVKRTKLKGLKRNATFIKESI
jgi:epoxyqueuosine reductase